jgi:hypothetical protein
MYYPRPTLEERGKIIGAVPQWNILPGERATVDLILATRGQDVVLLVRAMGDGVFCPPPIIPDRLAVLRVEPAAPGALLAGTDAIANASRSDVAKPVIGVFIERVESPSIRYRTTPTDSCGCGLIASRVIIQIEKD